MKKTSEELLDFFGLKVDDRVIVNEEDGKHEYVVKYFDSMCVKYRLVENGDDYGETRPLIILMNCDNYEIVKKY